MTTKKIWVIDPVHTRIRFDVKYLMMTWVSGWFRELEGTVLNTGDYFNFNDSEISLTIYTHSLYTGNEERDNHLRSPDFLGTKQYPTISFRSTAVAVQENNFKISGQLSIKDLTQKISFEAKYLGSAIDPMGNTKVGFEMDTVFDRKDFDITGNQFFDKLWVLVSDQVKLHGDIQLLKLQS